MTKKEEKMIQMDIRKALPDNLSYSQKVQILEKLADEYRAKSRKEVYGDLNYKGKGIDYTPIMPKANADKGKD
jgi:hypothetical protein